MIHPQAAIDPSAEIAEDVEIGPFSVIGANVKIGSGSKIAPHVVINGPTVIGERNRVFQFASIGEDPQDKKYHGEPTELIIGDENVFRESCTVNRGTVGGGGVTRVGDRNLIMAYVHIAHDCIVGDDTIFANGASLAGHVTIQDHVILGGFTMVHQFCRVGAHSFTSMASAINRDVPPYLMVAGHFATPRTINSEGLRRRGYNADRIAAIKRAFKTLYRNGHSLDEALEQLDVVAASNPDVELMTRFIRASERSIIR